MHLWLGTAGQVHFINYRLVSSNFFIFTRMGLDVCKICDSEKSGMNHQFPKDHDTALQQTAGDIQNGFCGAEDPGAQDPNLTFETQMLYSQPVLYVNHKQLVQKVCIYVVGDDLGM